MARFKYCLSVEIRMQRILITVPGSLNEFSLRDQCLLFLSVILSPAQSISVQASLLHPGGGNYPR